MPSYSERLLARLQPASVAGVAARVHSVIAGRGTAETTCVVLSGTPAEQVPRPSWRPRMDVYKVGGPWNSLSISISVTQSRSLANPSIRLSDGVIRHTYPFADDGFEKLDSRK